MGSPEPVAAYAMALEDWLGENVETEENRDRVRSAASGLGDLRACELEDLQDDNVIERHIKELALPAPAPAAEDVDDDATAPYGNQEPQPRCRPRDAAATPAAKPKAGARGTAAKHPKPHGKIKRNSAGDAAEWDETTGEWFFKKPRGRAPLGATSWDASTGEWVGEQQPPSAYRAGKRAGKPAAAAPAPKKRKKSQARHAFAVGERVEAHWQKKWWPAVVHGLEDDGRYEVHWEGDGRYDFVAANAVRAVPSGSSGFLGRIFGK